MKPELVELALRKQRLQTRSAAQREALVHHAQAFTPVFAGVDRVVNGVLWARDNAPILSGLAIFLVVARPRAALRWVRRGWLGWQLLRRARNLIP
ncbi:YqjK-like family protein [Zoogloea sp.]|uniref:YqjK-like family protein n=1 Tax=Zoogloea sp. TaxID=49181 RepID=UPI002BE38283|nr:YqjK-like family protein [Zoogloea sp.]